MDEAEKMTTTTTARKGETRHQRIPLGRARDCPTLMPRAIEDDKLDRRHRPFVKLAVVGMVVLDEENEENTSGRGDSSSSTDDPSPLVLITRRPSYMRAFPGAFVFPGGNVDAEDESLEHALSREIFEETGLVIETDAWKLECLWESIYPTQLPPLLEEGEMTDGAIKAHHLVGYFSVKMPKQQQQLPSSLLKLCKEEIDGAVWISRDNIRDLLEATANIESSCNNDGHRHGLQETIKQQTITLHSASNSSISTTNQENRIPLSDLAGIYPRLDEYDDRFYGMAQGSLFALEELIRGAFNVSVSGQSAVT